jgi:hypothetical protein
VLKSGLRLYQVAGDVTEITFHSVISTDGALCEQFDGTQNAAPVQLLADLTGEYVPPFRLRFSD